VNFPDFLGRYVLLGPSRQRPLLSIVPECVLVKSILCSPAGAHFPSLKPYSIQEPFLTRVPLNSFLPPLCPLLFCEAALLHLSASPPTGWFFPLKTPFRLVLLSATAFFLSILCTPLRKWSRAFSPSVGVFPSTFGPRTPVVSPIVSADPGVYASIRLRNML